MGPAAGRVGRGGGGNEDLLSGVGRAALQLGRAPGGGESF